MKNLNTELIQGNLNAGCLFYRSMYYHIAQQILNTKGIAKMDFADP